MGAELLQASGTESWILALAGYEPDARLDLVYADDVYPRLDRLLDLRQEMVAEDAAVKADRVDGLGVPVVPLDLGLVSEDVAADLAQDVAVLLLLIGAVGEGNQRH